jgi:hypothetical protein
MKGGVEMTSCADVRENISAYADNELSLDERQSFEEHISKCPSCKEELEDMLRIIEVCRSMPLQELPEGFGAELHEKLTAVSSRQGNIHVVRQKPKKTFLTRTIASIAAGILLIFLGGGIVRFGLLSGSFMSKNSDSAPMKADTPATAAAPAEGSMAFTSEAAQDMDNNDMQSAEQASVPEADVSGMTFGILGIEAPSEATAKGLVADRSVTEGGRDNGASKETVSETAASKSSSVTITAKDIDAALGEVAVLAEKNNGTIPEVDGSADIPDMAAVSAQQEGSESQKQLRYVFAETDYSAFIAALNDTFGAADVQTGAFVSEDMTDSINMLIDQSVKYDAEIQRLQNDNTSQEEINKLKSEKESIDAQIEQIRLNSDFVTVTVYVNMK